MSSVLPLLNLNNTNNDSDDEKEKSSKKKAKSKLHVRECDKVNKADKGNTVAERVSWFGRTSDVVGSFLKTDIESLMELIRRRIQEKCATTMDLITKIRRTKVSESSAVTPNEFRFTLIKFGITLDQDTVNRIFKIFDSDGSGTMDFDEFAMWIMNSEFQPKEKVKFPAHIDSPRTVLRKKFLKCVNENSRNFKNMKKSISFQEFVADVIRWGLDISEWEARSLFQSVDPYDSGFVESAALVLYARSGSSNYQAPVIRPNTVFNGPVKTLLRKVIGPNTHLLEQSFSHVKRGLGTKMPFEEFRRCLVNAGVGKNILDVRQIYNAVGGKEYGAADVDLLFASLDPILSDPKTDVSIKVRPTVHASAAKADRALREQLRRSYKKLADRVALADKTETGFIDGDKLHRIICKICGPMNIMDFRFICGEITKSTDDKDETMVDYNHFLHCYNPKHECHQFNGLNSLRTYKRPAQRNSSTNLIVTPTPRLGNIADSGFSVSAGQSTNQASCLQTFTAMDDTYSDNRSVGTASYIVDDMSYADANSNAMDDSGGVGSTGFAAMNRNISIPRPGTHTGIGAARTLQGAQPKRGGGTPTNNNVLRRIWHAVLRECHRADPKQLGQISRNLFIAALQKADTTKQMTMEEMNKLATTYTLPNGRINYILCFRQYLGILTQKSADPFSSSGADSSTMMSQIASLEKSLKPVESLNMSKLTTGRNNKWGGTSFPTTKEGWGSESNGGNLTASSSTLLATGASIERQKLQRQFKPDVMEMLERAFKQLSAVWRPFRQTLKKAQVQAQSSAVTTAVFVDALVFYGISITKDDIGLIVRSFRGTGHSEVVIKYDEFLRACIVAKGDASVRL